MVAGLLIAGLFFWLVERWIGWAELLAPWGRIAPAAVAGAVALLFVSYLVRALRIQDYFRAELRGRFATTTRLVLIHNLLNNFLPMRSGELGFPLLMQRYFAIPPMRSVPVLLWFRLLDLHTLALLGLAALGSHLLPAALWIPALLVWLLLPLLLHAGRDRLQRWCARGEGGRGRELLHRALQSLPQSAPAFWRSWGWTLLNWGVKIAVFAAVLRAFVELPPAVAVVAAIGGDLTSVLPIHGFAGAGTYEAGVVAGASLFGATPEAVLAGAVNLHLFVLGVCLIGGAVALSLPRGATK